MQGAHVNIRSQHLFGYPVVKDGIATFKSNPYGQRSLQLGDSAYKTFAAPVLPYFSGPYQYVSPYVKKADDLGEKTLVKVDQRFPVVRKSTDELRQEARNLVSLPYRYGMAGKDHVLDTYNSAKTKVGGDTYVSYGKALISTAVTVAGEAIESVTSVLGNKQKATSNTVPDAETNGMNGDDKTIN